MGIEGLKTSVLTTFSTIAGRRILSSCHRFRRSPAGAVSGGIVCAGLNGFFFRSMARGVSLSEYYILVGFLLRRRTRVGETIGFQTPSARKCPEKTRSFVSVRGGLARFLWPPALSWPRCPTSGRRVIPNPPRGRVKIRPQDLGMAVDSDTEEHAPFGLEQFLQGEFCRNPPQAAQYSLHRRCIDYAAVFAPEGTRC